MLHRTPPANLVSEGASLARAAAQPMPPYRSARARVTCEGRDHVVQVVQRLRGFQDCEYCCDLPWHATDYRRSEGAEAPKTGAAPSNQRRSERLHRARGRCCSSVRGGEAGTRGACQGGRRVPRARRSWPRERAILLGVPPPSPFLSAAFFCSRRADQASH